MAIRFNLPASCDWLWAKLSNEWQGRRARKNKSKKEQIPKFPKGRGKEKQGRKRNKIDCKN